MKKKYLIVAFADIAINDIHGDLNSATVCYPQESCESREIAEGLILSKYSEYEWADFFEIKEVYYRDS